MRVVCTGKGTHREVEFEPYFTYTAGRREVRLKVNPLRTNGRFLVEDDEYPAVWRPGEWRSGGTSPLADGYEWKCKRCRRNPKLSRATLVRLLDGLKESGESLLDVSHLPF